MPHITLEYSQNLIAHIDVPKILADLHAALVAEGIPIEKVKTRSIVLANSVVTTHPHNEGQMMHVTLALLEGRDIPLRQKYGQALYDVLRAAKPEAFPECVLTLEVREMIKDTYFQP